MRLFGIMLWALPAVAQAQFTFVTNNGALTITGYSGPGGAVAIPGTNNGLPVTAIGADAFYNSVSITSVTIPNSVTGIGEEAFEGCDNLASITIPNSVTTIGDLAFISCSSLTNVSIGSGVANIGAEAFQDCVSLTAINVSTNNPVFSSIAGVLFNQNQTALIECPGGLGGNYTVPNGVTSIGDYAFAYCPNLVGITLPGGVTSIGTGAFESCYSLAGVNISNSVTNIGDYAFALCSTLTSVTLPGSVTGIGAGAFEYCSGLSGIIFWGSPPSLGDSNVFSGGSPGATAYYAPGTAGWGPTFGGLPTVPLYPQVQTGGANFGVRTNQFGFNILWGSGRVIVVEAATNLANPVWTPLQTNTPTNNSFYFSDPGWTNFPSRYYRLYAPAPPP